LRRGRRSGEKYDIEEMEDRIVVGLMWMGWGECMWGVG
jgi:hypothetical protein